jgi:nicotinamide-nucleotide amidase
VSRSAVVLTIGNEIVSGDTENTNASWLARRLATLGVQVKLMAALPDDVAEIGEFLRVPCEEIAPLAAELRERFGSRGLGDYAARWACIPRGSRPLANPLGGAPGFALGNVYVLPGLPSEMEGMFDAIADDFRGSPIATWRRRYRTTEGGIVGVLEEATSRYPSVLVGSYPRFDERGPEVDVVLKSPDGQALAEASAWVERALAGEPAGD